MLDFASGASPYDDVISSRCDVNCIVVTAVELKTLNFHGQVLFESSLTRVVRVDKPKPGAGTKTHVSDSVDFLPALLLDVKLPSCLWQHALGHMFETLLKALKPNRLLDGLDRQCLVTVNVNQNFLEVFVGLGRRVPGRIDANDVLSWLKLLFLKQQREVHVQGSTVGTGDPLAICGHQKNTKLCWLPLFFVFP